MLRIHAGSRAEGAKAYFEQGLGREDYYTAGSEVVGTWYGQAADRLSLEGDVSRDDFHALCENRKPGSEESLTERQRTDRRVGFDISFSVPKSVSVHQALTDNNEILEAFRAAVNETMVEIERDAKTRVRRDGADHNRTTGNLAWAEFVHFTSRPVDDRADPHLHAHCYTFNATWDSEEERWKALELAEIWRRAPYYQAAFDARIARKLSELGYRIERTADGWELSGYGRDLIERFSRRTDLIEAFAEANGISNPIEKNDLGARTREKKGENQDKAQQRAEWASRLSGEERALLGKLEASRAQEGDRRRETALTAAHCLDHAVLQSFERQSVVREANFMAEALKFGVGQVSVAEIQDDFEQRKSRGELLAGVIEGRSQVTTPKVLAEERAMVAFARDGRGTRSGLGGARLQDERIEALFGDGPKPDENQLAAVHHVLTSQDRVILVRGKAGTGKTTMMQAAAAGIRENGRQVYAFAPSSEASRGVLRDEGFTEATTVQHLLLDERLQEKLRGQVIWIDEAGLLGAKTMRRVFELSRTLDARVVLSGDASQHAPVERGDALRILETEAGLKPAELTTVYRQKNTEYKKAVEAISTGDPDRIASGFDHLQSMGAIVECDDDTRYERLARDYVETVSRERKSALVVSPTHREGASVTAQIRMQLKDSGIIETNERRFSRLRNRSWTEAEKRDGVNYRAGLWVQFHQGGNGFRRGDRGEIVGIEGDRVLVRVRGKTRVLNRRLAARFDVFEQQEIGLSVGDQLRITRNGMATSRTSSGRKQELRNGAIYEIAGFTELGDIQAIRKNAKGKITSEVVIGRDFGHLSHGYCVTSHASQGKTVDRVFIAQGSASLAASNREQFYVSVSRARETVRVYTDDAERLRQSVLESSARKSATALEEERMRARAHHAVKLAASLDATSTLAARGGRHELYERQMPRRVHVAGRAVSS